MSRTGRHTCLLGIAALCLAERADSVALAEPVCARRPDTLGWYVPDHAKLQTGGQLGLLTVGVGYDAWDMLGVDLYYGFVPAAVGGTDIHSGAVRVDVRVPGVCLTRDLRWRYVSFGLGALFTAGEWFFLGQPDGFPDDYYDPTALRVFLTLGTSLDLRLPENHALASVGAFIEVTALDVYTLHWIRNTSTLAFWDVWSTSLGVRVGF